MNAGLVVLAALALGAADPPAAAASSPAQAATRPDDMLASLIYSVLFPRDAAPRSVGDRPKRAERLTIEIDGGEVEAWFIPAPAASADRPAPVVIYFHGNAEIIDQQADVAGMYAGMGVSVLLPEFRGYGRSAGVPTQDSLRADMTRFYDAMTRRPDVDPARIVFHGRSVGGAIAADLALHRKPAALVLVSSFTSVAAMAALMNVPALLVPNLYRTDRALERLDVPVLIFHGRQDEIIPVEQGRALRQLAKRCTYVEVDSHHNDFPGEGGEVAYAARVGRFLGENGLLPGGSRSGSGRPAETGG